MEFLEILKKLHKNPNIVNKLFGEEYFKKHQSKEFGILAAARILEQLNSAQIAALGNRDL